MGGNAAGAGRQNVRFTIFGLSNGRGGPAARAAVGSGSAERAASMRAQLRPVSRLAAAMPQAWRSPWPPAGARGGGDMGEKPTPPEGRQRPHAARHGPKRAGAQPGRSARSARTPPPARPERPEAARPPEKAAGSAGARHGGGPAQEARPAGRATRKKDGPRRSGARANRAARRPDRRRFLFCPCRAFLLLDTRTLFRQSRSA